MKRSQARASALQARGTAAARPGLRGRLAGGRVTVIGMTEQRAASNAKAKRELGWTPGHASWRDGFRTAAQ